MSTTQAFKISIANWDLDHAALESVRKTVFIDEQGVPAELEYDIHDRNYVHAMAQLHDLTVIGTARLLPNGVIGRMAVMRSFRSMGVGQAMLALLLREAKALGIDNISLNAQISAEAFYHRNGFESEGEVFLEAGIKHIKMRRLI